MTLRRSSGSSVADSAVEPTRSTNITVSCRRSAASAAARGVGLGGAAAATPRPAIALSRRLRCPSGTPSFSRSLSVSSGRMSASISLARNIASYWPSPTLRSQSPTSMVAPCLPRAHDLPDQTACPGRVPAERWTSGSPAAVLIRAAAGTRLRAWPRAPRLPAASAPSYCGSPRTNRRACASARPRRSI